MTTSTHKAKSTDDEDEHKGSKAAETPQPLAADTTTSIAVRMTANLANMHAASPSGTSTLQKDLMTDMKALRTLGGF
jgi:hypothetical protein